MNKKKQQDEKLFSHNELNTLLKKMDELDLIENLDNNLSLTKAYNKRHKRTITGKLRITKRF